MKHIKTLLFATSLCVGLAVAPTWAAPSETGPGNENADAVTDNTWLELKYSPEQISGGGFSASTSELKMRAETGLFDDKMRAGVYFQTNIGGNNGTLSVAGVNPLTGHAFTAFPLNDIRYNDVEVYMKLPFNLMSELQTENTGKGDPTGLNVTLGWKDTQITGNGPVINLATQTLNPNAGITFVGGQGFGGGLGYDAKWQRFSVNALVAYYPSQNFNAGSSVVVPNGGSVTYRDWVYRIYARTVIGPDTSGLGVGLGFDGESLQFSNATLSATGVTGGIDYHF
ncbi:MAG TPA: hypothetical protein VGO93_30690 [Candidatus Xenobia bacterium]